MCLRFSGDSCFGRRGGERGRDHGDGREGKRWREERKGMGGAGGEGRGWAKEKGRRKRIWLCVSA